MLKDMFVWHCRPRGSACGSVDRHFYFSFTKCKQKFLLQIHSKCKFCMQKSPREDSDNTVFLRIAFVYASVLILTFIACLCIDYVQIVEINMFKPIAWSKRKNSPLEPLSKAISPRIFAIRIGFFRCPLFCHFRHWRSSSLWRFARFISGFTLCYPRFIVRHFYGPEKILY